MSGAKDPARRRPANGAAPADLLRLIETSLDDDQAIDRAVVDLTGKTPIADFMVIASGRSARHIGAMAEHLKERVKAAGEASPPIEGLKQCDWVLIDTGAVVVHLFRPEVRALYNLEKMWGAHLEADTAEAASADDNGP